MEKPGFDRETLRSQSEVNFGKDQKGRKGKGGHSKRPQGGLESRRYNASEQRRGMESVREWLGGGVHLSRTSSDMGRHNRMMKKQSEKNDILCKNKYFC